MWQGIILLTCVIIIFLSTSIYKINAFLALIFASVLYGILSGMSVDTVTEYIKTGFGDVFYKTGLIYLFGIIIGVMLEKTGAAQLISESILKRIGKKKAALAMAFSGYVVSVPVNCDSGFLILSPMCRAISSNTGMNLIELNIFLACGLFLTHTLVPPTAGPTTVTAMLGADMGSVIAVGLFVAAITLLIVQFIFSKLHYFKKVLQAEKNEEKLEWHKLGKIACLQSFLPILYPLIMICMNTIANLESRPLGGGKTWEFFSTFGNPIVALFCAMIISFTLIPRKKCKIEFNEWIHTALREAATIVLINSSAGAFAEVISNSELMNKVQMIENVCTDGMSLLIPFLIAVVFKAIQGSSTVAMIATAGIITSFSHFMQINPVLYVLAIGAGSMVFSHTNDSFFWVVAQMTGLDVKDMLLHYTIPTTLTGICAFGIIYLLSLL